MQKHNHIRPKNSRSNPLKPLLFTLFLFLAGCQTANEIGPTLTVPIATATASPTVILSATTQNITCADLDTAWGNDWVRTIDVLHQLLADGETCGQNLTSKLYAAHFSYGVSLENEQSDQAALAQYQAAFMLDSTRREALNALVRLNGLPDPTPAHCDPHLADSEITQPIYPTGPFVTAEKGQFVFDGEPFPIRGVNYYPRHAPWHRFLPELDLEEADKELQLISTVGLNTIRLFLWYDPLFTCEPETAVPQEALFAQLDQLLALAEQHQLKAIITLHDLPDLLFRPLYTDWDRYDAQTRYIVSRYQAHPTILAWDLRNEGDLDYGARGDDTPHTPSEVIDWLAHTSELVRAIDQNHLITAGWWGDPAATAPYVDFLSFHHWYDAQQLQARIELYQQMSNKPILLEEIGYHSWAQAPQDKRDEASQAALLQQALETAEDADLAGWVIWTAFDFQSDTGNDHFENHFGLWHNDLTPKAAVEIIKQFERDER